MQKNGSTDPDDLEERYATPEAEPNDDFEERYGTPEAAYMDGGIIDLSDVS